MISYSSDNGSVFTIYWRIEKPQFLLFMNSLFYTFYVAIILSKLKKKTVSVTVAGGGGNPFWKLTHAKAFGNF